MAAPDSIPQKPIHSLIIDTGPLINNAVSISTIINSAEELYTTPAILSEIRDEATRSRVQTTLVPFLKIRTPSAPSYDAVIAFSKKTGDHAVLSKQDLGILALAYEIYCERNGGDWGLREAPKQPIKRRPGEEEEELETGKGETEKKESISSQKKVTATEPAAEQTDDQPAVDEEEKKKIEKKRMRPRKLRQQKAMAKKTAAGQTDVQPPVEEGWEQPRGKRAIKSKHIKPAKEDFWYETVTEKDLNLKVEEQMNLNDGIDEQGGVAVTQEQILEQEVPVEPVENGKHGDGDQQVESRAASAAEESLQDEREKSHTEQLPTESESKVEPFSGLQEPALAHMDEILAQPAPTQETLESMASEQEILEPTIESANLEQDMADLTPSAQPHNPQQVTYDQLTPPATSSDPDSDSDSEGSWITPSNLPAHQAKDSGIQTHAQTTKPTQIDVATMTIDFAMQNVLLQMNLHLLSTNMQRIKHLSTKVLRCHACFFIVKQLDKQFCPRCGQATLRRVSCSTNANGEFRIHLSKNYQWNTRGDKYSIPKPIAGTANGKWSGQGGGKGGWGRDLVLAEDQKEFQRSVEEEKRRRTRDLMDEEYLPGILTGERGKEAGRVRVGAGRNVNSRKKF